MIRLPGIRAELNVSENDYPYLAAKALRLPLKLISSCRLIKKGVDARKKSDIHFSLTLDVNIIGNEQLILKKAALSQASIIDEQPHSNTKTERLFIHHNKRPVVIGAGPAGLFCALTLARAELRPILLERGKDVDRRQIDVMTFWKTGMLQTNSNVQFGEGGAGTFSDGKLNTGINDFRCRNVLKDFVSFGAPEEILWEAKPHIGTDHLPKTVKGIRQEIKRLGGEVLFESTCTGIRQAYGKLCAVEVNHNTEIETDAAIFAVGHSARDTFVMLYDSGIQMIQKPFSIGARIEHPQEVINRGQYGTFAGHPSLGAADYKLSYRASNGRGVYTFCMCPGGSVVAATSEKYGIVTNGMSCFARNGINANSALLVDVLPADFGGDDPLAGIRFQQKWENTAYNLTGCYQAPAQRVEDFLKGRASKKEGSVKPSYPLGVQWSNLQECLPEFAPDAMCAAIKAFDEKLHGFAYPDAVLTGVETRSSCPLRILRNEAGHSSLTGLFPSGEGAGYAGGILSAAVDGIKTAERVINFYEGN